MRALASQNEIGKQPWLLSSLDWRVWFLGYGVGGCAGLSLIAGIWSVLVDGTLFPAINAIAISSAHSTFLSLSWARRSTILAKPAIRNCFLLGSIGIATVAISMNEYDSLVPSLNTLYTLAFMSFIFAFVMPLQAELQCAGTKRCT